MSGKKDLIVNSLEPRPVKLTSWVEQEVADIVRDHGQTFGMKPSQIIRKLILLGLEADGADVCVSTILPRSGGGVVVVKNSDIKPQKGK